MTFLDYDSVDITATTDPTTFSAFPVGAAAGYKYLVICAFLYDINAGKTIAGISVAGVAATQVASSEYTSGPSHGVKVFIVTAPSATTADIVFTVSGGTVSTRGISVYELIYAGEDYTDGVPDAADTGTDFNLDQSSPRSVDVNITTNGNAVGCAISNNGSDHTWSTLSKDFGADARSNEWISSASLTNYATGGSATITASNCRNLVVVSFT